MYARLQDPCVSVRKNAVLVLSHLILNDMMKVKGHINEMAVRLEDENERISNLAKLFFLELSKKGNNPIYNLLPDILSKLSKQNLSNESFCNIMQFLIASIKKDRQMKRWWKSYVIGLVVSQMSDSGSIYLIVSLSYHLLKRE
ncbi:unnamed protein product [Lathyrus sativus]|nr:unnamed protein product [Lathyrus sativus]